MNEKERNNMADDRMFLRNKITGKTIGLAKHFSNGWYNAPYDELQEFFDNHRQEFFEDPRSYEIVFETSPYEILKIIKRN